MTSMLFGMILAKLLCKIYLYTKDSKMYREKQILKCMDVCFRIFFRKIFAFVRNRFFFTTFAFDFGTNFHSHFSDDVNLVLKTKNIL